MSRKYISGLTLEQAERLLLDLIGRRAVREVRIDRANSTGDAYLSRDYLLAIDTFSGEET